MEIEEALGKLRELSLSAGIQKAFVEATPRPTPEDVDRAEEKLSRCFHPDYRRFLLEASHCVCGPLEPALITLPGSRLDLVAMAKRAWETRGVPEELMPICEHGESYYCLDSGGGVVLWSKSAEDEQRWGDLASFIQQVWIDRLTQTTGNPRIDDVLRGVIGLFESHFPGQVHSYYLEGSQSDGHAVMSSDIDVVVLFKRNPPAEEVRRIARVRELCQLFCPQLDIRVKGLDLARRFGTYGFNIRSRLLYGPDARGQVPVLPLEDYTRSCVHPPYYFMSANLRGRGEGATFPLGYPDPTGEFFGYNQPLSRSSDGVRRDGLKAFISCIVWAARAIAVLAARRHLSARNSDGVRLYKEWVGDDWTPFLEELLEKCRDRWQYVVPEGEAERRKLRELCRRAIDFENHFLEIYRSYLLDQVERAEKPRAFWLGMANPGKAELDEGAARLFAIARLEKLRYDDEEVLAVLERATRSGHDKIRAAAEKALRGRATREG